MAPLKIKENVVASRNTCTCRNQNIVSDTATCSYKSCVIKIYHLSCLGLEVQPKGKWLFVHNVQEKKLEERNQNKHF